MSKEDMELDDDFVIDADPEVVESEPVSAEEEAKNNLTKRRIIDNYLEERRLKKQISDFDFDL